MADTANLKKMAGEAALDQVESGMKLGIGTGSTAEAFVRLLARKVHEGLDVVGVTTSDRTEALCREQGISTATLEEVPELDLSVDGADEVDGQLRLIKGGGGALLREKIVAAASNRRIVIADRSKKVDRLGAFPLPIEINGFGMIATYLAIQRAATALGLEGEMTLRRNGDEPYITDSGHLILDAAFGSISDPDALSDALLRVPGVVEHGLFIGMADCVIFASDEGIERLER